MENRMVKISIAQDTGPSHPEKGDSFRLSAGWVLSPLALYLLGYVVLFSLDYFDLAQLPWSPHIDDWLYQIYRPMEWLRSFVVEGRN
jgi:hypothetical protein